MPKEKEFTNHPCHLLSLPSAKRFWCRHCMSVFEDAITRWRHSRSCRYGVVNNFMRRRELEAKALQNTTVLNPVEARLEQSIQMCDLAAPGTLEPDPNTQAQIVTVPDAFTCFICHQKFASLEEMRAHVKYPCNNSKIITSRVPHPKHSVPVFIDALPDRTQQWQQLQPQQQQQQHQQQGETYTTAYMHAHSQSQQQLQQQQQHPAQATYDIEIQSQQEVESQYGNSSITYDGSGNGGSDSITPTNIYVNEQGETVIEVENLDLNSEGGELSLAHLLTQLSQQGIVFDKTRSGQLARHDTAMSGASSNTFTTTDASHQHSTVISKADEEEEQPTAEDAANTLAQLAGFRGFTRTNQKTVEVQHAGRSQIQTVSSASYTAGSSTVGQSGQYTLQAQPQIDIKYEYEYSGSPSGNGQSVVNAQQLALEQAIAAAASQDYESVKVEQEETDDSVPVHFYNDSTTVTYVSDGDSQQHHQVEAEPSSSMDEVRPDGSGEVGPQPILIQHYPVEVSNAGQLISVPIEVSSQQISGTVTNLIVSNSHTEAEGELATAGVAVNTVISSEGTDHLQDTSTVEEAGSKVEDQMTENSTETDDFTIQTVTLQEIVDSEFGGQSSTSNSDLSAIPHASVGLDAVAMGTSLDSQAVGSDQCSQVTSGVTSEEPEVDSLQETTPPPTTVYVVTSSGILPVSNKHS